MEYGSRDQILLLRQRYGVPETEELWGMSKGEMYHSGSWLRGTFVLFRSRVGFSESGCLFEDKPLVMIPFGQMQRNKPPVVTKINDHPLHSNEVEPYRLWIFWEKGSLIPDSSGEMGIALRGFSLDPINPKRLARLTTFLFNLEYGVLPPAHLRLWRAVRKDNAGQLLHSSDLNALTSAVMFPDTTALLTARPDIITLDNVADALDELSELKQKLDLLTSFFSSFNTPNARTPPLEPQVAASSSSGHPPLLSSSSSGGAGVADIPDEKTLRSLIREKALEADSMIARVDAVCGRFVGHLEHEVHEAYVASLRAGPATTSPQLCPLPEAAVGAEGRQQHHNLPSEPSSKLPRPGQIDAAAVAEIIVTNNRLYMGILPEDLHGGGSPAAPPSTQTQHGLSGIGRGAPASSGRDTSPTTPFLPTEVRFFFSEDQEGGARDAAEDDNSGGGGGGSAAPLGGSGSAEGGSRGSGCPSPVRDPYFSLDFASMKAVYRLQEIRTAPAKGTPCNPGTSGGAGEGGSVRSSHLPLPSFFDPFVRPTEWAMSSGGNDDHPSVSNAIKVVVSMNDQRVPCHPKYQTYIRTFIIRASEDVREYYHSLVVSKWLRSCWKGVQSCRTRLSDALGTAVRVSEKRWARRHHLYPRTMSTSVSPQLHPRDSYRRQPSGDRSPSPTYHQQGPPFAPLQGVHRASSERAPHDIAASDSPTGRVGQGGRKRSGGVGYAGSVYAPHFSPGVRLGVSADQQEEGGGVGDFFQRAHTMPVEDVAISEVESVESELDSTSRGTGTQAPQQEQQQCAPQPSWESHIPYGSEVELLVDTHPRAESPVPQQRRSGGDLAPPADPMRLSAPDLAPKASGGTMAEGSFASLDATLRQEEAAQAGGGGGGGAANRSGSSSGGSLGGEEPAPTLPAGGSTLAQRKGRLNLDQVTVSYDDPQSSSTRIPDACAWSIATPQGMSPCVPPATPMPRFGARCHALSPWCTQRLLDHFQSIDESGDGDVAEPDFCRALAPLFRSDVLPSAFFRVFDTDGNGAMSFEEFLTGMTLFLQGQSDKLTFVFLMFDSDGDGRISREQFHEIVRLFLLLNGLHPGLIDSSVTSAADLSNKLFDSIDRETGAALSLVEFREALLYNSKVQIAFKRLRQHGSLADDRTVKAWMFDTLQLGGDARTMSFLGEVPSCELPAGGAGAEGKCRKTRALAGDVLSYVSDTVESMCKHHLITFGHEDWPLMMDVLDGIREAARKSTTTTLQQSRTPEAKRGGSQAMPATPSTPTPPSASTPQRERGGKGVAEEEEVVGTSPADVYLSPEYRRHAEDVNVFIKSGGSPGCYSYHKVAPEGDRWTGILGGLAKEGDRDPEDASGMNAKTFRYIAPDLPPVVYIDHAPVVFKKIRELQGISSNSFFDSLGLNDMLVNLLTGSTTALRHMIASGASLGQFFFTSFDRNYIIRTISDAEKKTMKRFLPGYLRHVAQNPHSLLPKYYSLSTVKRDRTRINVLVMGRVLDPQDEVRQMYDLRASFSDALPCRLPEGNRKGVILSDIDLRRNIALDYDWHGQLLAQVSRDIDFMKDNGVVGYSFLTGFDSDRAHGSDCLPIDPVARMDGIKASLVQQAGMWSFFRNIKAKTKCIDILCCTSSSSKKPAGPDPPPGSTAASRAREARHAAAASESEDEGQDDRCPGNDPPREAPHSRTSDADLIVLREITPRGSAAFKATEPVLPSLSEGQPKGHGAAAGETTRGPTPPLHPLVGAGGGSVMVPASPSRSAASRRLKFAEPLQRKPGTPPVAGARTSPESVSLPHMTSSELYLSHRGPGVPITPMLSHKTPSFLGSTRRLSTHHFDSPMESFNGSRSVKLRTMNLTEVLLSAGEGVGGGGVGGGARSQQPPPLVELDDFPDTCSLGSSMSCASAVSSRAAGAGRRTLGDSKAGHQQQQQQQLYTRKKSRRARRHQEMMLKRMNGVNRQHILSIVTNLYHGERTSGFAVRKRQQAPQDGVLQDQEEGNAFKRYHGGVPSSDRTESIFVGFIDCLREEREVGEAEDYGDHFMAYLETIFERKQTPTVLDPATLPNDVIFDAKLESDAPVKLSFDVPNRLLHVYEPAKNGKAYLLGEPYKIQQGLFSIQKPLDKYRQKEVLIRGAPKIVQKKARRGRRCVYECQRRIFFPSMRRREEFCSMAAFLRRMEGEEQQHAGLRTEPLKVFCGTWNVGERPPGTKQDLNGWLGLGRECDLVAVAAQECDYKPRRPFESCEEDWFNALSTTLNDRLPEEEQFIMVDGTTMWQMRLVVFAKVKRLSCISDVVHYQEATGLAHVGGNKGGVAIGMKFLETPILFVGCHLAAHQESMLRRHSDIEEIIQGISDSMGTRGLYVTTEFPHVFWMGDLNYRIDTRDDSKALYFGKGGMEDLSRHYADVTIKNRHDVMTLIQQQDWETLRRNDQLKKAMSGKVGKALMPHFVEAGPLAAKGDVGSPNRQDIECPNFPPTFKVFSQFHKQVKDNSQIDLVNDFQGGTKGGTVRVPSWCDRVLRSNHFGNRIEKDVTTLCYNSCRTVVTSDHKPVYAVFKLRARDQYLYDLGHVSRPSTKPRVAVRPVIQLSDLSASHLMPADPNGKSDPYLVIFTDFCSKKLKTEARSETLSPRWREVVTIVPEFGDLQYTRNEYIYFVVYDKDAIGSDDLLGQAVLSLEDTGSNSLTRTFDIPVYTEGRLEGRVRGRLDILEVPEEDMHKVVSGTTVQRLAKLYAPETPSRSVSKTRKR